MRRIMVFGGAVIGAAVMALPLTAAVASSDSTHPPHVERRDAASVNTATGQSPDAQAQAAGDVNAIGAYVQAVQTAEFLQAVHDAEAATARPRSSGGSGGGGGGGGGTCAGSIPGHIIYRESKCNPMAVNSRSGAAGKYQVLPSTWAGYGGYATADQAPEDVQDAWAAEAYAAAGCRPWGGC
jgi:hypothetical protein